MENGSTTDAVPIINPAELDKLALSKQQFYKRRKIAVHNLPDIVNVEELKDKLLRGCDIKEVKFERNTVKILFSNADQAEKAIKILNGNTFNDDTIRTEFVNPDSLIFVGNLPFEFKEEEFVALMSKYGSIERIFLVRSEVTGESKGYGFVEYPNKEIAGQAKQSLMNSGSKYIGGRILRVDFAEPNLHTYKDLHSKTLFIDKLPRDFTDGEVLREIFSKTGHVTFAQVAINQQTGASRGFAFVDYESSNDAERAQKSHNGAKIEESNIRVAYGTPGRSGASILGIQPTVVPVSQAPVPLLQAGVTNIRGAAPQWSAQQSVPHPLMAGPLMVQDLRPQNIGLVRGPAARFPVPLMAPGPPMQRLCNPRATMFIRPMMRAAGMLGMGSLPQRPPMRGPRPLMAEIPFRGVGPRPGGPRGLGPRGFGPRGFGARGISPIVDPRCVGPKNGAIRPLMDLNGNGNVQQLPEEKLELNQAFNPQMEQVASGNMGVQPVYNQMQPQQQPQQIQPLMQPQVQQPRQQQQQQQQQQQRLVSQQPQNNPPRPQQMQNAPPQPLMQDIRPAGQFQSSPVLPPQPLLSQQIGGPNIGVQPSGQVHLGTHVSRPIVSGMEPSFGGQSQQASGPAPLLGPRNGHRPEHHMSRPQPVGGQIQQQGQLRQPAALPNTQPPVKTFSSQMMPDQVAVPTGGPTPLMAIPNQNVWAGQQGASLTNGSQRIPQQVPNNQTAPGQYGIPSQQLMQHNQIPAQPTPPQGAGVPRQAIAPPQQNPNVHVQYQNYSIPPQNVLGSAVDQVASQFMGEQVQQQQQQPGYAPQSDILQQVMQPQQQFQQPIQLQQQQQQQQQQEPIPHQQPIQQQMQPQVTGFLSEPGQVVQPPQQMYQQGPMVSATPTQWVQPAANSQQAASIAPLMPSGQPVNYQALTAQQEPPGQQIQDTSGQQWSQQPAAQSQPVYGQPQQPKQMYNPTQQFQPVIQPIDPSYQQQPQVSATNTSTPSPIPQHSAAPVMYNTETSPTDPIQHGQKRLPDQLSDQSYLNQPQPIQGMGGEFYDAKRPRF